jgi:hypothetical protein
MMDYRGLLDSMESSFNKAVGDGGTVVALHAPADVQDDFIGVVFYQREDVEMSDLHVVQAAIGASPSVDESVKQRLFSNIKQTTGLEARML